MMCRCGVWQGGEWRAQACDGDMSGGQRIASGVCDLPLGSLGSLAGG